jgi:GNAT superfamily N-acetyltransferase
MSFQTRPMRAEDLPAVHSLQCDAYSASYQEPLDALNSHFELGRSTCLVAVSRGCVAGYLLAHPWSGLPPLLHQPVRHPTQNEYMFIHDLVVAPALQRSGAAVSLLSAVLKIAERDLFSFVRLVSLATAVSFWQKRGFSPAKDEVLPAGYGEAVLMYREV